MNLIKRSVLRKRLQHVIRTVPPSLWNCADDDFPGDPLQIAMDTDLCAIGSVAALVQGPVEFEIRGIIHAIDECFDLAQRSPYKAFTGSKAFAKQAAFARLKEAVAAL